jgi:hypothetical protein
MAIKNFDGLDDFPQSDIGFGQAQPNFGLPQLPTDTKFGPAVRGNEGAAGDFANVQQEIAKSLDARNAARSPAPNVFEPRQQPQLTQEALDVLSRMGDVSGQIGQAQGVQQFEGGGVGSDVGLPPAEQKPFDISGLTTEQMRSDKGIFDKMQAGTAGIPQASLESAERIGLDGKPTSQIPDYDKKLIERLGGGPEAIKMVREARQQEIVNRSGQRAASRKIAESLQEQGMKQEDIEAALGTPEQREKMSPNQTFKALNRIQRDRTKERLGTANEQRGLERLRRKARTSSAGTANDAQKALDHKQFFDDTGPDPESEKTNESLMTPPQKREFQRYMDMAKSGRVPDRMQKRMDKIQAEVGEKAQKEFDAKKAQRAEESRQSLIQSRIASAKTAEESRFYSTREKKIKALEARKKSGVGSKEKVALNKKLDKLNEEIAVGYTEKTAVGQKKDSDGKVVQIFYSDGTIEDV